MRSAENDHLFLPRSFRERFWLVILGGGFAAFMVFIESLMFQWRASGILEHVLHFVADETFITFGLFAAMACLWGLCTPRWIEGFLDRRFKRVLRVITVIAFASVLSVLLFLWSH
jgi:hypothetical protein